YSVTLNHSTVSGNSSGRYGAGIRSFGDTVVNDSVISGNISTIQGSGVGISSIGNVTVNRSTISDNSGGRGGAIFSEKKITLNHSTISGNSSRNNSGGIHAIRDIEIDHSLIINNTSGDEGGGIGSRFGNISISNSTIANNSALNSGGGIRSYYNVAIANSNISNNTSSANGGGLFVQGTAQKNITLTNSSITGNSSGQSGGAIYINNGNITAKNTPLTNNQASNTSSNGILSKKGKVTLSSDGDLNLTDAIQTNNYLGSDNTIRLQGNNINISIPIESRGSDIRIEANSNVTAFTADASISSHGSAGSGDITIIAGGNLNLRNVTSFGFNDGGNISITSTGGVANTTFGGSEGTISASGRNGNAGSVAINAASDVTIGQIFADSEGGSGGNVNIATSGLVQLKNKGSGLLGITDASISTAGGNAGGTVTIRHGGSGQIPFTIGDASINGTAGSIDAGTSAAHTLAPTQSFLFDFRQGNIQLLTTAAPGEPIAPVLGATPLPAIALPQAEANPPTLTFYNQTPVELFVKLIGDQLGATTTIDYEDGKFAWTIPGEPLDITGTLPLPKLDVDISAIDEYLEGEYEDYMGVELDEEIEGVNLANIREMLTRIEAQTNTRPVMVYALSYPDALDLILITTQDTPIVRRVIPEANAKAIRRQSRRLVSGVQRLYHTRYLEPAQQLYRWLIEPIQDELDAYNVDTLIFAMSAGLRTLPLAALHDGNQFLVEQYSLGQIPSVSLTNSDYQSLHQSPVVAMGASQFRTLQPLPAVPVELAMITHNQTGQPFLNEAFTLAALRRESQNPATEIVHLATHAAFQAGQSNRAFIQFWDQKVRFQDLRDLGWYNDPQMELLVLSACETALGDANAELGFAGLAVQSGVKSALASLWQVSDLGTLALMTGFYDHLRDPAIMIKAEALRQAQLSLLRGEVSWQANNFSTEAPELAVHVNRDLSHPYYWSAFTLVGSPW
ncbi:MAG: CHAT domain-containing protein, partial [Spirulina sp. SIO3F2]|nr:CHAT domain-containing protein [Spirulina sp. SIO3F2]